MAAKKKPILDGLTEVRLAGGRLDGQLLRIHPKFIMSGLNTATRRPYIRFNTPSRKGPRRWTFSLDWYEYDKGTDRWISCWSPPESEAVELEEPPPSGPYMDDCVKYAARKAKHKKKKNRTWHSTGIPDLEED